MSNYIVGDIQGCYTELTALLKQVNFNEASDTLFVAGDLVARGPDSLSTLRFLKSLGDNAKVVLGNHDLHLLAIHAKIKKNKRQDLLDSLLAAPDVDELINWLAQQPLIQKIPDTNAYVTHAGLSPQWRVKDAIEQAEFVHKKLSGGIEKREKWLARMYGELPNSWADVKTKTDRFRFSVNALTRMRYCHEDGSLEFDCKESPNNAPKGIKPWFELTSELTDCSWVFGHWAALMGECAHPNVYALDTGCVWGNHMTMLRWEDKKLFTQIKYCE